MPVTGNPIGLLLVLTYTTAAPPAGKLLEVTMTAQMKEMTGGMRG